jgi:hypothetical protein
MEADGDAGWLQSNKVARMIMTPCIAGLAFSTLHGFRCWREDIEDRKRFKRDFAIVQAAVEEERAATAKFLEHVRSFRQR